MRKAEKINQGFQISVLKSTLDNWKEAFQSDNEKWLEENQETIGQWHQNEQHETDEIQSQTKEDISDLITLYREQLRLDGPVDYWKQMASKHKDEGYRWMKLLAATVLFMGAVLLSVFYNLPETFNISILSGDPIAIKSFLLLATFISFFAYLAKILGRLTFSSFHLHRDAQEREQLTHVYLALLKEEGAISVEDRALVLQSIFSRSDTGLIGKDSSPTMPGVTSTIQSAAKPTGG